MNTAEAEAANRRLKQMYKWYDRIAKLERKWATLHQVLVYPCRGCGRFEISELYRSTHVEQYVANVANLGEARELYRPVMRLRECHYNREFGTFNLPPTRCNFIIGQFEGVCQQCQESS